MTKLIVIVGPTSVGKTKLSIELAKKYNGEIINADSMQIYKGLNIGTAKVTDEEKENIPHHLFDIRSPFEDYSIYEYQQDVREKIKEINSRHKTIIIVGGTGLYIKSALYDYQLNPSNIQDNYDDIPTTELYHQLINLDKDAQIDCHNRRRIIRALNYYKENNQSITNNKTDRLLYDTIFIGLTTDREKLYERINNRVDQMLDQGLLAEVKSFYDQNIRTKPLTGGIGYKELYAYFDNEISLPEAIDQIKKNSRHYAKRQYTFFNNQLDINWFNVNFQNFDQTITEISKYLDQKLK